MVSTHKYNNFKHVSRARTFQFMVLLIMVVATVPQVTLFFIGVLSILSGPLAGVYRMFDIHEKTVIEKKTFVYKQLPPVEWAAHQRITL